ncbi:type-F conjugative transfer system pilin assembly protein TrbC [Rhodobacterales bacterium 52_120_T64]|nr:type-F conjugative transfer system pilin assembly protein TrbC [Rhodobacterales bacterium 52_120_T64]
MASLAKKKLLCALGIGLITSQAFAQEDTEKMSFAEGATGYIKAPITELVIDAEHAADELGQRLTIQGAMEGVEIPDLSGIRDRALNDPRVRKLLGVTENPSDEVDAVGYDGAHLWLLLSFSMPKISLQQAMREAEKYGVPVVFRGFVNNSVYDTRAAILDVWETEEEAKGFGIDPTIFTRFNINAVPVVIAASEMLEICETQGCEGDPVPPHDRVSGNIPLETVLAMIAHGDGVGAFEAARMIAAANE